MELTTVAQMKTYLEEKFTSTLYVATVLPISARRKNPEYTTFEVKWSLTDGTPQPHLTGKIRCYKNGVTSTL
jgi:hypothetical protein